MMKVFAIFIAVVCYAGTVYGNTFGITNCVLLKVDGAVTIDAIKDGQTEFSFKLDLSANTPYTVSGNCSEQDTSHSMTMHFNQSERLLDWTVLFTTKDGQALMDQMIKFTPSSLFKNSSLSSELVLLTDIGITLLSLTNSSFVCKAEQSIPFESAVQGGYNFTVTQVIRDLQVQAFNLKGQTFSPAEECSADLQNQTTPATESTAASKASAASIQTGHTETSPATTETSPATTVSTTESNTTESTPQPTTVPPPVENTYVVYNKFNNETCIVLRGDIAFANIVYNLTDGGQATADPITIPRMNQTEGNVKVSGTCGMGGGDEQLVITFYKDWSLTMTFAHSSGDVTSKLGAGAEGDQYSLRDIQFEYALTPEFFPNASAPDTKQVARAENMTDFLMGSANGGSYKCNSKITKTLDNGVQMETTNLQYKAFNDDANVSFGDDVSECPADDGSSNVVPIAVGAAIGALVVIMLIAYIIGRHRRNRGGYDSL